MLKKNDSVPGFVIDIPSNNVCNLIGLTESFLSGAKTGKVQIYIGISVQTVLLLEILFILFTFHFCTKWHTAEMAKCHLAGFRRRDWTLYL